MFDNENDYIISYLSDLEKTVVNNENFISEINLFSRYLSHSNINYQYNETYLKLFCQDFLEFKQYVAVKNPVFKKIVDMFRGIRCDVRMDIDKFWTYEYFNQRGKKPYDKYSISYGVKETLCTDKIFIKCVLMKDKTKLIFENDYPLLNNMRVNEKTLKSILIQIKDFTNGIK
nr:hypothetical protein [uncultured Anaerocolumna sp.]